MKLSAKVIEAANVALQKACQEPTATKCSQCGGSGYEHLMTDQGPSPDWCSVCGGNGVTWDDNEAIEAAINAALEAMKAEGNARSGAGAQMPGSSVWIVLDGEGVIHEKQFPVLIIRTEQT